MVKGKSSYNAWALILLSTLKDTFSKHTRNRNEWRFRNMYWYINWTSNLCIKLMLIMTIIALMQFNLMFILRSIERRFFIYTFFSVHVAINHSFVRLNSNLYFSWLKVYSDIESSQIIYKLIINSSISWWMRYDSINTKMRNFL